MSNVLEGVQYHENILDTIGHTPLVRLRRVAQDCPAPVLAKLEFFNPGGSVKDRIGLAMVEAAEREGRLKHGGTIVECTSGNTGLGLAMVAAVKGYRAVFCMPDKVSSEKVNLLKAFGAEVLLSPTAVAPEHSPESYYSVAKRIATERPGALLTNQYHNPANPEAHYRSTGPELWEQTNGRITHFVAGMGTGGTISGTGALPEGEEPEDPRHRRRPGGLDPQGLQGDRADDRGAHLQDRGRGRGLHSERHRLHADRSQCARCNDRDGLNITRTLAREEAIFVGGSAGMAAWVALRSGARADARTTWWWCCCRTPASAT